MSKNDSKKSLKNVFTIRISNDKLLAVFNELYATGIWESQNILINKILANGINDFARLYLDHDVKTQRKNDAALPDTLVKEIKQTRATTEDIFVIMTTMERMVASLFNSKVAELSGEKISVDEITSGIMSDLPDDFKAIKEEIIRLRAGRVDK